MHAPRREWLSLIVIPSKRSLRSEEPERAARSVEFFAMQ
jgi:hypothetical protein